MTTRWIVTALGKDRAGLVAGITKVLYELGCNLEDSAMTRLEGEFTIMLIFSSPSRATEAMLRKRFAPVERSLHLTIHLKRLTTRESSTPHRRGPTYRISVYGADRAGIVYKVSDFLARSGVNITDVHTHRSPSSGSRKSPSLYLLLLEVEVPARRSASWLEGRLKRVAKQLRVEVSLRPSETAVL